MKTSDLSEYADLQKRKRQIKADLSSVNAKIDDLGPRLAEQMVNEGIARMTVDGMTLYPSVSVWASVRKHQYYDEDLKCECEETPEQALTRARPVLAQHGLDTMIKPSIHHGQLSAWVREQLKEGGIPEDIKEALKITEKPELRARR
jgi:hypothetical protein